MSWNLWQFCFFVFWVAFLMQGLKCLLVALENVGKSGIMLNNVEKCWKMLFLGV